MRMWMYHRQRGVFIPMRLRLTNTGRNRYAVWGRFRIKINGDPGYTVFDDTYEIKKAQVRFVSRNNFEISEQSEEAHDDGALVAMHIVLPPGFTGKCILPPSGSRLFYDYSKKSGTPPGYKSVMAFVRMKNMEMFTFYDCRDGHDGLCTKITAGVKDGSIRTTQRMDIGFRLGLDKKIRKT